MLTYTLRRLLWLPMLLLIITFITFLLGYYGPGRPEEVILGQRYDPEAAARIRHELGLDQPLLVQYGSYLLRLARLDFGESIVKFRGQPIINLILPRLWVTLQLNFASALIGVPVGIILGILAAYWHRTILDRLVVFLSVLTQALPVFVLGPVLLFIFARNLKIVPAGGWHGLFSSSAILPVLILSTGPISVFTRQTRAGLLDVMQQDYIRTARAKGLRESVVVGVHALRNALIPLLTIMGFLLGGLVEGTFLTETIFGIPGMGLLAFDAFNSRDYPIIMALTIFIAISYALANLWVDLAYGVVDPRIREG
jgi:peptide/nickel transport system permease protein